MVKLISLPACSLLFFVLFALSSCGNQVSNIEVGSLTVEYLYNPIGVDKLNPNLSWKLYCKESDKNQTAYQIIVASSPELLRENLGDLWNSGKVESRENLNIQYAGKTLLSNTKYYWKLRVWDEDGLESEWSPSGFWTTGILKQKDWRAKWISNKFAQVSAKREPFYKYDEKRSFIDSDTSAIYYRKIFLAKDNIKMATAYITGLGYFELYLNGKKVGNHVLDPVFTDYQKTVKYLAYDITSKLESQGPNTVAAVLGNGFYNHNERDLFQMEKANWKTPPKLLCQIMITYESGETELVLSDPSWKWSYGPIVYNSIRGGETIDTRISFEGWNKSNFNDILWNQAIEVPEPIGKLSYQYMPPLREVKSLNHFI